MPAISEADLWLNYINEMRRPSIWPDKMLLMCSSWFIGRDVVVLSEDGEGYSIRTRYQPEAVVNPGPELFLGYIKNTHYQALVPIRTVLHEVMCSRCGKSATSLKTHLNHSPICRSYYNIPDLDEMAKTMRRCEQRRISNHENVSRSQEMLRQFRSNIQAIHKAEIRRKQERVRQRQEKIRVRSREYYRKNRDIILQKRAAFYKKYKM